MLEMYPDERCKKKRREGGNILRIFFPCPPALVDRLLAKEEEASSIAQSNAMQCNEHKQQNTLFYMGGSIASCYSNSLTNDDDAQPRSDADRKKNKQTHYVDGI